jgi:hypothetical protein
MIVAGAPALWLPPRRRFLWPSLERLKDLIHALGAAGAAQLASYGGPASLTSISIADSTTSSGSTVAWSAVSEAVGDAAILVDMAVGSGSLPASVTPTGFTLLDGGMATSPIRSRISYRIIDGTESGSITGMNGAFANNKMLLIVRGNIAITTVSSGGAFNQEVTTGNPTLQNVNADAGTPPMLVLGFGISNAAPAFVSTSPAFGTETTVNIARVGYTIYNSSPVDQAVDINDGGTNGLGSGYITFS